MIVVDASVAVELVLRTPIGLRSARRVFANELHAPHLLDIEVLHTLRRLTNLRQLDPPTAQQALESFQEMTVIRHPHGPLLEFMWEMRSSISAYDAAYVALAEALEMPLLTCDAKLARASGHGAKIVLIE